MILVLPEEMVENIVSLVLVSLPMHLKAVRSRLLLHLGLGLPLVLHPDRRLEEQRVSAAHPAVAIALQPVVTILSKTVVVARARRSPLP